jgi:hypothetical protein
MRWFELNFTVLYLIVHQPAADDRGLAGFGGVAKPPNVRWGCESIEQLYSLSAHIALYVPTR